MIKRNWMGMLVSTLALTAGMNAAHAGNLVVNGGFETGDLSGWTTNNVGSPTGTCPSAGRDWNVSTNSSTGCSAVAAPASGRYAAYVMNDGTGPVDYILEQTIADPFGVTNGVLSFQWTTVNFSDSARTLTVSIDGVALNDGVNVNGTANSTYGNFGWTNESIDVTSILQAHAGQAITLEFDNHIPRTWSGPAGLGLDNVALNVAASPVPEPGSIALFGVALAGLAMVRRKAMDKQG